MIDIHFHCLPGIDDGPESWSEAVDLCRAAADDGITTIVATPHVLRDRWLNQDAAARHRLLDELNRRLGGRPNVVKGCEYYFSADAVDLWHLGANGPLTGLNETNYLLMEFPASRVPEQAEAVVHEFAIGGVRPVIAHPERNITLARNAEKLERLVQLGALTQITAASVIGTLGPDLQKTCDHFFRLGLVHFIASDSHSLDRRPPCMAAARERVRQAWGDDAESMIFETNPQALLRNEPLPIMQQ